MAEEIQGYRFAIDMDDGGMAKSLQVIRQEARALKTAMQSNFAEIRTGEGIMQAYANKVQDAGRAIQAQQALINRLKEEQAKLDLETDKGQKAYLRYENQINSAKRTIASLTAQQEKAKTMSSTETQIQRALSDQLEKTRNATARVKEISESYVKVLETEGRTHQAAKAKLDGLINVRKSLDIQLRQEKELLQSLVKTSGTTSEAYQNQKIKVEQLSLSYRQNEADIRNQIKATTEWPKSLQRMRDSADKVKTTVGGAFKNIRDNAFLVTGAVGGMSAVLIKGANKASELNSQYNVIKNNLVTGGESVAEATRAIARMQADGEKYSLRYGKSQKEIADAYLELVKRGYTSQQAIGAMNTELQGSIASGDEFSDVVEVASQTLEGFGMTVDKNGKQLTSAKEMTEQTKKAVNTLAYSADVTSTSFQSLGVGMSYVSSTAHQAGFTLAETASAMGVLSNAGLEADKALVKLAA
ncbi:phage tail tape measure protein [Ligilactobacillus agilis]|uniref:phage tail tape measure protein n=2 Tax=Ligilactobacillus agilis TaxID=1601 RepID=UPI00191D283B|nr:phage tail tape measure protein [Ligilactobacillus agilis]MBL1056959.1 phage tail tape measure protein [Ligilactobacillus agilis]